MDINEQMKKAQEMAAQAQQAAAQGVPGAEMAGADVDMEYMQRTNRIGNEGLDGEGTIKSVDDTGKVDAGGAKQYEIKVDATVGGDSFEATALQYVHPKNEGTYKPGGRFEIKADPEDKTQVLLMGGLD